MSKIDSDHQAYKVEAKPVRFLPLLQFSAMESFLPFSTTGAWTFNQRERNLRKARHSDQKLTSAFTWDI